MADRVFAMRLGIVVSDWRYAERIGIREAAKQIGISHGTLSRIERGEECDGATLRKLILWLMSPPEIAKRKRSQPPASKANG